MLNYQRVPGFQMFSWMNIHNIPEHPAQLAGVLDGIGLARYGELLYNGVQAPAEASSKMKSSSGNYHDLET
jgi:hypothetical protein